MYLKGSKGSTIGAFTMIIQLYALTMNQRNFILLKKLFPILLACNLILPVWGQLTSAEIDHLVEDAMEKFTVAGVAVGVVKDGEIIHAKGYGVKSVDSGEKVDEHTSFAIASNSKAFTSAALAILVEEGLLSWQDRVVDHIPEFKMYNDYVTQNFNIQDLLTHRSGLGLGAGDLQKWPSGSDFTIKDMLVNFQHFEPVSAFRTKYDYDNILYLVAGEVIKRVSGMTWEEFVKSRIMEPLDMDNSFTLPPSLVDGDKLASPHLAKEGKLRTIPYYELDPKKINGAAGGVLSNVDDLCRWMLVHLNEGRYGAKLEKQLFSAASQREMWQIHTSIPVRPDSRYNTHFSGYGLGWRLNDMHGQFTVSHTGDLSGMLSKTIMLPDLELGVVVLTNSYYGGAGLFSAVSQTIVDAYLGLDDHGWTDLYLASFEARAGGAQAEVERVWKRVEEASDAHIDPEDYTGEYEDPWFGKIKIYLKGDQLWFSSSRSPALTGPMYFYQANAFAIRWEKRTLDADAFAIFRLDEEGKAQGIRMKGISPDIDFSYDFQDLDFKRVD
jgi:CubicO group peptidase (beta-lactamase class C family)